MRINGFDQGLSRPYIAGLRVNYADCQNLATAVSSPAELVECIDKYMTLTQGELIADVTRDESINITRALAAICIKEPCRERTTAVKLINNLEYSGLLVERIVNGYISQGETKQSVERARRVLDEMERIMMRPEMLTRPL